MGKMDYLAMKTDQQLLDDDFDEFKMAAKKLFNHAAKLGGLGFGSRVMIGIVRLAKSYNLRQQEFNGYLLILDRTNWKSNILTALLIPYIFFTLPNFLFHWLRGEVGKWIAIIAVVLRLFFPRHFPDWLELPGSFILLVVVAPSFFADTIRGGLVGAVICLVIGCYLLQEHIRVSGGFRNSFTQSRGISNSVGIVLLLVYPVWALILHFL